VIADKVAVSDNYLPVFDEERDEALHTPGSSDPTCRDHWIYSRMSCLKEPNCRGAVASGGINDPSEIGLKETLINKRERYVSGVALCSKRKVAR